MERALHAASDGIVADNALRAAAGEPPVRLRIGIHSGPAIVGNIGAPGRVNYTLVGDTVNTAQRLEGLGHEVHRLTAAEPRDREGMAVEAVTILISSDTAAALPDGFVTRRVGSVRLRGRSAETEIFALLAGPAR